MDSKFVKEALKVVGEDKVSDFSSFVITQYELSKRSPDPVEYFKAMRTNAEVHLALYDYADFRKQCQDSKNSKETT